MELAITPTPAEDERDAVRASLELALTEDGDRAQSAWWAAGLPDADDDGEP